MSIISYKFYANWALRGIAQRLFTFMCVCLCPQNKGFERMVTGDTTCICIPTLCSKLYQFVLSKNISQTYIILYRYIYITVKISVAFNIHSKVPSNIRIHRRLYQTYIKIRSIRKRMTSYCHSHHSHHLQYHKNYFYKELTFSPHDIISLWLW